MTNQVTVEYTSSFVCVLGNDRLCVLYPEGKGAGLEIIPPIDKWFERDAVAHSIGLAVLEEIYK